MKKKILFAILFMLIGSFITVGATILLQSNQILYKNDTTVEEALNDLYTKSNIGDALASDIKAGKKALVGGKEVTGSLTVPSYTNLSGTQSVGAGAYSTLLNGYYNLSDYRIKCGSNSCSACNSCCSGGLTTGSLSMDNTSATSKSVSSGHFYIAWAANTLTLNSGGTVLSSPGNLGRMRDGQFYPILFKATSSTATFNRAPTLVHLGY